MKIRSYLALMVGAILVPVVAFSAIALNMMLKAEREAALKGVREMARISLVTIDRELTNTRSTLRMLSISTHLSNGEFGEFYEKARYADQFGATITALLDEHGQLLLTTSVPYGTVLPPTDAAARVNAALTSGHWQVSNLLRTALTKRTVVVVDVPVLTQSGHRYVLSQGYEISHFNGVLRQVNAPAGWLTGVYDRNGKVIAQIDGDGKAAAVTDGGSPATPVLRAAILQKTVGVIRTGGEAASAVKFYTVLERSALSGWTVAIGVPEAEIEAVARHALALSLLGLLAAFGCAGGTAWLFVRRLSISIRGAARSANNLERGADAGPALPSGVEEVDAVQAAIVAAGAVIGREKAQRQAAEEERARLYANECAARAMAEQQNRAKDEFLAMLGHELRNPLAAIVNAAQVLKGGALSAASSNRAGDIIVRQSGHLTRIVDDLLDVGRVHSGKILLTRQPLRLDTLVAAYADSAKSARGARHSISVQVEPVWIDADPTRIEQIVANLVDNAIKYTPAGGAIALTVGVSGDGTLALLAVVDSGIGIGPELMPTVFDLFVQGERGLDRAQGGMGVGLALVRQLALMHGGQVAVHSAGVGQGSRFEVALPAIAAPLSDWAGPAGAIAPAVQAAEVAQLAQAPQGAPTRLLPPPVRRGELSILVIEDNDDGREMMAMMLESHGYLVHTAVDGADGVERARSELPDIALVDIGLPGIDGYEVARRLRANPATAAIVLVALTGYGLESDRQRALAAGFDGHLVKPVELVLLMAVLAQVEAGRPILQ
ncbi:hybrid sensor histidine kinase/response regulator [Massilia sp. PWRC2]|uniref:hybrid sensor histidine kinase/response regulator n=1 Tax=Massilia sp. PWRC2 TaxID=2804626 RepID=UPI003CEECC57